MTEPIRTSGGYETNRPNVFVTIKVAQQARTALVDGDRTIVLVGEAEGGAPNTPYLVRSEREATEILRRGQLLDAAKLAFSPSPNRSLRPPAMLLVNPKPGTPARHDFLSTNAAITLTATTGGPASGEAALGVNLSAALAGAIPKGTRFTFTGSKVVETTADFGTVGTTGAQSINVKWISGAAIVAGATPDTASYVEAMFVLETVTYRELANQTTYAVSGAKATGYTITVKDTETGLSLTGTDLGLGLLIRYTGATAGTATVAVATVSGVKRLQTAIPSDPAQAVDIPLAGKKIRDLVTILNNVGVYAAVSARDGNLDADLLDVAAAVDIKVANPVKLTATKGDISLFFATRAADFVKYTSGPADGSLATGVSGYFARGASGTTLTADWQAAVEALADHSFAVIVPLTDDEAIASAVRSVNADRSDPSVGRFGQVFLGAPMADQPADSTVAVVNAWLTTVQQKVQNINDHRTVYVVSTATVADPVTGVARKAKTFEVAAMLAGLKAALGPDIPLTYKNLAVSEPFPKMDNTRSDRAVKYGALALEVAGVGGPTRVILGRNAYVGEPRAVYESEQGVAITNSIARSFKALQESFIPGNKANTSQLTLFAREAERFYESFARRGWLTAGLDTVTGEPVPAYRVEVLPTAYQGRLVRSRATVNPALEFVAAEHEMTVTTAEIEVA